ncbi:MAG: FAD-dependent oxidoreductase, partial [Armatimonadota bacterium]|nr:FAD-dependent oxidoreductase [Armatimonadota bacterium]
MKEQPEKKQAEKKPTAPAPKLTGRILYPGDPGWEESRRGFGARFDYDAAIPRVIVFCQDAQDVANAVKWARANKVPIRARCGRHNYEGYSSLVKDGIIIDVSEMESVRVSRDATEAVVGAGIDMLQLSELLWDAGVCLPLATGPSVGVAGLTLGGGFGITSRRFGLMCDNLTNVQLVNAQGEIINANKKENPNLFWACQGGGGGNFGIATAFTFKVHKVGVVAAFNISWSWDQFERVVELWQSWAYSVDDNLTSLLSITVNKTITLLGQYTAEEHELPQVYKLLEPLLTAT